MQTKLILTLEKEVVKNAKEYGKKHQRILFTIEEEYLKSHPTVRSTHKQCNLSQISRELKGSVKDPNKNITCKELLQNAIVRKHLN